MYTSMQKDYYVIHVSCLRNYEGCIVLVKPVSILRAYRHHLYEISCTYYFLTNSVLNCSKSTIMKQQPRVFHALHVKYNYSRDSLSFVPLFSSLDFSVAFSDFIDGFSPVDSSKTVSVFFSGFSTD